MQILPLPSVDLFNTSKWSGCLPSCNWKITHAKQLGQYPRTNDNLTEKKIFQFDVIPCVSNLGTQFFSVMRFRPRLSQMSWSDKPGIHFFWWHQTRVGDWISLKILTIVVYHKLLKAIRLICLNIAARHPCVVESRLGNVASDISELSNPWFSEFLWEDSTVRSLWKICPLGWIARFSIQCSTHFHASC